MRELRSTQCHSRLWAPNGVTVWVSKPSCDLLLTADRAAFIENLQDIESKETEDKDRLLRYKAALTSEKNHFHQELNKDFRKIGQSFILEQIKFYRQLADRLETLYSDCWPDTDN